MQEQNKNASTILDKEIDKFSKEALLNKQNYSRKELVKIILTLKDKLTEQRSQMEYLYNLCKIVIEKK